MAKTIWTSSLVALCLVAILVGNSFAREPRAGELPLFDGLRFVSPSDDDYDAVRLRRDQKIAEGRQIRERREQRRISFSRKSATIDGPMGPRHRSGYHSGRWICATSRCVQSAKTTDRKPPPFASRQRKIDSLSRL